MVKIGNEWDKLLREEWHKPYYLSLREFLKQEYKEHTVYPNMHDLFAALKYTSYSFVKAVILGQDPYHQPGQAHGLCFSVKEGVPPPPSLVNIFKELKEDLGVTRSGGELIDWAKSGVLLLNAVLTVRRGEANSHRERGWEQLTDKVISLLNEREEPLVFILWGAYARAKMPLITNPRHLILKGAHPSPLSANNGGFFGGKYFSKTNAFLSDHGIDGVEW